MKSARFDTLQYSKKAREVGFTEQQAEFQAQSLESLAELLDKGLATKNDLSLLGSEIRSDITQVKKDIEILHTKINSVDSKLTWLISLVGIIGTILAIVNFIHFHS